MREEDLQEHFARGSGKGGQAVNKTSNKVVLRHVPTNTVVHCHAYRSLEANRKRARSIMKEKLEEMFMGAETRKERRALKKGAAKDRRLRRQVKLAVTVDDDGVPRSDSAIVSEGEGHTQATSPSSRDGGMGSVSVSAAVSAAATPQEDLKRMVDMVRQLEQQRNRSK